ncbi:MAG: phosphotransferase enzyme family protein [Actinomycetales bacterium]
MSSAYEALARQALPAWGINARAPIELVNLSENATYFVHHEPEPVVLRVHRPGYHDARSIESELAWIAALRADLDLVAPTTMATVQGRQVCLLSDRDGRERHAVMFRRIPGVEPADDQLLDFAPTLGEMAARMHEHALSWRPPSNFCRFSWNQEACLGEGARWGRPRDGVGVDAAVAGLFTSVVRTVRERLTEYGTGAQQYGLVHADMRLANLLVDGPDVALIDFDDAGYSWFLYDLAAVVSFVEADPRLASWCHAWLAGYRRYRALEEQDLAMVATFIMLRRLMLVAWIGSHRFTALAQSLGEEYTRTTCDLAEDYLAGAGWSREVSG